MKALIIKDFYSRGTVYIVSLTLFIVAISFLYIIDMENLFIFARLVLMFMLVSYGAIVLNSDGEKETKWYLYESILPISKKDIVDERFLLALVYGLVLSMVSGVVLILKWGYLSTTENYHIISEADNFCSFIFIVSAFILITTMSDVLSVDTGQKIAIIFGASLCYIVLFAVSYVIADNIFLTGGHKDIIVSAVQGSIIWFITLIITYCISRIYIKKREYV